MVHCILVIDNFQFSIFNFPFITKKVNKGAWRMPWLWEAMKDVISCDKPRLGANNLSPVDFRMGQPGWLKTSHPSYDGS